MTDPQNHGAGPKPSSFYAALQAVGVIGPFFFTFAILLFKPYFDWLGGNLLEIAGTLFIIGCVYLIFFVLYKLFRWRFVTSLGRYAYVLFFLYFIYLTGQEDSPFLFTALLPTIGAAVYFDRTATRNVGFITTILLGISLIVFPELDLSPSHLVKDAVLIGLFGYISYLIYGVMIETIRQQIEKEETTRRMGEMLRVDRLKKDFLSVAQHQLRTPLSGVKWALESLSADPTMPQAALQLIDSSLVRVKDSIGIINQMLKTVETEGDLLTIHKENVDLVGMVRSIIAELNFVAVKKEIKLNFICPDSLLILADREKMKPALVNVIDNAIKYSPKGQVDVMIADAPTQATLTVKDTGIGIRPEDMPYVFERLHRGKNAVMVEPDESGVGLYTSKKIIELHGGTISVASELNRGTTVTVVLPKK